LEEFVDDSLDVVEGFSLEEFVDDSPDFVEWVAARSVILFHMIEALETKVPIVEGAALAALTTVFLVRRWSLFISTGSSGMANKMMQTATSEINVQNDECARSWSRRIGFATGAGAGALWLARFNGLHEALFGPLTRADEENKAEKNDLEWAGDVIVAGHGDFDGGATGPAMIGVDWLTSSKPFRRFTGRRRRLSDGATISLLSESTFLCLRRINFFVMKRQYDVWKRVVPDQGTSNNWMYSYILVHTRTST
jgi:hypothetical protein